MSSEPRVQKRWGLLKRSNSCEEDRSAVVAATKAPRPPFFKKGGTTAVPESSSSGIASFDSSSPRHRVFGRRRSNDDGAMMRSKNQEIASSNSSKASPSFRGNRFRRRTNSKDNNEDSTSDDAKKGLFKRNRRKLNRKQKSSGIKSDGESSGDEGGGNVSSQSADEVYEARRGRRRQFLQQTAEEASDDSLLVKNSGNASILLNAKSDDSVVRKQVSFDFPRSDSDEELLPPLPSPPADKKPPVTFEQSTMDQMDLDDTVDLGYNTLDFPMPSQDASFSRHQSNNVPSRSERRQSRERARYSVYHGSSSIKKRFRVRPYHCFSEATYMTEEDIYTDSLTPSKEFEPLKSYLAPTSRSAKCTDVPDPIRERWGSPQEDGRIGALRVEVLGCVSLNRTKPDVSVYLVCGDSAFCTDVLNGYRSPMWPSVSRRACIFPIHHAYAKLYVGVFDARIRKNKGNDVFCGRVVIDIASIRPDTEYDTTMPLRVSAFVYDKRKRGVVRLRFSLHWFNERAAVTSYFKSVRSLIESCPLVEGQPAIPCADPKTFRNVAVTVYGQDLPGKYSRNAFRATMREFNLYQQNLRLLVKVLVLDAMLYEKPRMSLYLFCGAMYCVLFNSVRMVPAIFVGYILILFVENYFYFVEKKEFHLGYKPLTIEEVFKALVLHHDGPAGPGAFEPLLVKKRTKRRRASVRIARSPSKEELNNSIEEEEDGSIVPLDHREFPFSDRDAYPNFSVEDSLAPGSGKGGTGRLHGRLSVYYASSESPGMDSGGSGDEDEDSDDSDRDDETVMTESQMIGDNMFDLDSDAEEEDDASMDGIDFNYRRAMAMRSGAASAQRRIRLGPPQDSDVSGRKVPPQVQLKKVEHMLYKASRGVSVELVHAPPRAKLVLPSPDFASSGMTQPSPAVQASVSKRARKIPYDDFDKLLGLQTRSANPVHRIMSSFMGPLMRMIRVFVYLVRISFNASTWRDPYLSFWILVFLSALCLILIVFPWRSFFFLSSLVCLGPQNIFVRKYLERKAAAELEEDDHSRDNAEKGRDRQADFAKKDSIQDGTSRDRSLGESGDKGAERSDGKRGFFSKLRQGKESRAARRNSAKLESLSSTQFERPAFQSALHGQSSASKKLQPRSVAIPYSRLKKDRFYDWPPDPTVSRATPITLSPERADDMDDSLTASVPDIVMPDQDEYPSTLRRRGSHANSDLPPDIPANITF